MPDILLTIQPKFVERIRSGVKTLEIRKSRAFRKLFGLRIPTKREEVTCPGWEFFRPRLPLPPEGERPVIYVCAAGTNAIVCRLFIERIDHTTTSRMLWDLDLDLDDNEVQPRYGVTLNELNAYAPSTSPSKNIPLVLIHYSPPEWFLEPVSLPYRGVTRPPQTFAYLKND